MIHKSREVVITGIGMANPLGLTKDSIWKDMLDCKCGFIPTPPELIQAINTPVYGYLQDEKLYEFLKTKKNSKYMGKESLLAVKAAGEALTDAKWEYFADSKDKIGIFVGTGTTNTANENMINVFTESLVDNGFSLDVFATNSLFKINPLTFFMTLPNMPACHVSIEFGITGPNIALNGGTDQTVNAVMEAVSSISRGELECALVGGAESRVHLASLQHLNITNMLYSKKTFEEYPSKPFDKSRAGVVPSEGAAFLFVESRESAEKRGANIYASFSSYGYCNTFNSNEDEIVNSCKSAVHRTIENTNVSIGDIGFAVSSASSDIVNDRIEGKALEKLFKDSDTYIWSPKANYGETGVSSVVSSTAFCAMALKYGVLPPSVGTTDCEFELKLTPQTVTNKQIDYAMALCLDAKNSKSAILLRRYEL